MPIVTITRGSFTKGREVAKKLGKRMSYKVISREILLKASKDFNVPEVNLKNALYNAPSILDKFTYGKEKFMAFIRASILEQMVQDNVIYHGLAGYALLKGVGHELQVRIQADPEDRLHRYIEYYKQDHGVQLSEDEARCRLKKDDEERRKWSMYLREHDPHDANNYDLVYNASKLTVDDIVEDLARILQLPYMQATPESQQQVEEEAKAALVKTAIVKDFPTAQVSCKDSVAYVTVEADLRQEEHIVSMIKQDTANVQDVQEVRVHVSPRYSI
ncbi:MAG: AAA family ATPase [Desulfohalobiaceae bacterium]